MANVDALLTAAQAASRLQVHTKTLSRWRKRNVGPRWIELPNGRGGSPEVRYRPDEIEAWLSERTVGSAS